MQAELQQAKLQNVGPPLGLTQQTAQNQQIVFGSQSATSEVEALRAQVARLEQAMLQQTQRQHTAVSPADVLATRVGPEPSELCWQVL